MRLGIVVPTITGREESLERTLDAYRDTLNGVDWELITPLDRPNWPTACNEGTREMLEFRNVDLIHYGADDLVPLEGWYWPCLPVLANGELPAPRVWDFEVKDRRRAPSQEIDGDDGKLTRFSRVPILTAEMAERIGPWPEWGYYADVWVSVKARHEGQWPTRVTAGYDFVHYWHQTGRLYDEGEQWHKEFMAACEGIDP